MLLLIISNRSIEYRKVSAGIDAVAAKDALMSDAG
jgi:hypothetical protein